ncbi:unnamed protein product [Dibothriocephalus latus]|uniref:Uncharacterized protein n=1 Tax=Dibothriocephalus latus TaxID=60516 RepID=A0A3P7RI58_DIBLA|nr:unnamed protein product [Dibothriocephalus latus]
MPAEVSSWMASSTIDSRSILPVFQQSPHTSFEKCLDIRSGACTCRTHIEHIANSPCCSTCEASSIRFSKSLRVRNGSTSAAEKTNLQFGQVGGSALSNLCKQGSLQKKCSHGRRYASLQVSRQIEHSTASKRALDDTAIAR